MSEMMPCVLSWRGGLQGRFSGRLETKDDEKRLADECKLLGPLLGGLGKRGEKSRLTWPRLSAALLQATSGSTVRSVKERSW